MGASEKSGILWSWERPLGTPLGLVKWKGASSRGEAGTSGVLSITDSGRRVPAEYALQVSLCDPVDCSLPGSSVHGILQARILEWVAMPFSRGSSQPRDRTQVSCMAGGFFTV